MWALAGQQPVSTCVFLLICREYGLTINSDIAVNVRVDGGYQYTAMALDGEAIEHEDNCYDSNYFCPSERDFIAIDLIHESNEIFEEYLELMDLIEKQSD